MAAIDLPNRDTASEADVQEDGSFIGGVFCGREIATDIFAEELTSRRFVIRKRIEPNYAKRLGEVCGGRQIRGGCEFQSTRMNGEHVAMRPTLLAAVMTLVAPA